MQECISYILSRKQPVFRTMSTTQPKPQNLMTSEETTLYSMQEETQETQEYLDKRQKAEKAQRYRFLILTLIVAGIIGYLIFTGMRDTMGYYLTVSEILAQSGQSPPQDVRIGGKVSEGSVNWNPADQTLQFTIVDEDVEASLPVQYQGIVPDSFKQGQKVIVEGRYADGVFTAKELLTTCASKYE